MANSTLGVRLSEETQRRLERLGKVKDRSPHYLMKAAIEQFLDREESLEAERRLTRERWERFELTGETIEHDDVTAWAATLSTEHSPDAASRAVNALLDAVQSLEEFPERGRPWEPEPEFRELVVRFGARGYVIRYRLFEDQIIIVRVWHSL